MSYITKEMLEFLTGIRTHNNKEWFEAHKESYLHDVYEPLKALGAVLYQPYEGVSGMMYKTARIYKDANFVPYLHYRDTFWIYIRHEAFWWSRTPTLFFEIAPEGAKFGFRIADPAPKFMEYFRNTLKDNPDEFFHLIAELHQNHLTLTGDEYKRPKPCPDEKLLPYFRLKSLRAEVSVTEADTLYSEALLPLIQGTLAAVFPLHEYFHTLMQKFESDDSQPEPEPELFMPQAPEQDFMW